MSIYTHEEGKYYRKADLSPGPYHPSELILSPESCSQQVFNRDRELVGIGRPEVPFRKISSLNPVSSKKLHDNESPESLRDVSLRRDRDRSPTPPSILGRHKSSN